MIVLDIKLARHRECSALVASDGLRGYNLAKAQIPENDEFGYAKIVCTEKDFDLTKVEFMFPIMVREEIATEAYRII